MGKNTIFKNFTILSIMFIFLIFTLTGCSSDEKKLNSKTEEEINYMEDKIISMMNKINQITFSSYVLIEETSETNNENDDSQSNNPEASNSDEESSSSSSQSSSNSESENSNTSQSTAKYNLENSSILINDRTQVDWDYLKSDIETMYTKWSTILIDLHQLNVNNEDILGFSSMLDETTISIKQEDKAKTLVNLANLYAYFPSYLKQVSEDQQKVNMSYIESNVLNSYALAEQDRWDEMKTEITTAIDSLSTIMNGVSQNTNNQNKISKIYVLLNELNNTINLKDKDLYYIKYKNVMEELANF